MTTWSAKVQLIRLAVTHLVIDCMVTKNSTLFPNPVSSFGATLVYNKCFLWYTCTYEILRRLHADESLVSLLHVAWLAAHTGFCITSGVIAPCHCKKYQWRHAIGVSDPRHKG
jgi:hypothetical protein